MASGWKARRARKRLPPTDPAVLGLAIRAPGRRLAEVEAWCALLRAAGVDGEAFVFALVEAADAGPPTTGQVAELWAWPRASDGPVIPKEGP